MDPLLRISQVFADRTGGKPALRVRAPGRVNLIGEHTDYNDGYVLPMAIDRAVWIVLRPGPQAAVRVYSLDFDEEAVFPLAGFEHGGPTWAEYVKGMAWAIQETGERLAGWEGVIAGDVPIGAGLSSSAAMELAAARAFTAVSDLPWDPASMARLAQRAENEWVGVHCGIMDQMVSACGQEDHALLIDCRTLETRAVPLPSGTSVVILDTATRRGLVESAYNERREQCESAARHFGKPKLRDVTLAELESRQGELDPVTWRRARHVISENARTLQAAASLAQGDARTFGRLMDASHASLRQDFEVSSPELDRMVTIAQQHPACLGARMTGAGFGGCAVALVRAARSASFCDHVAAAYAASTGLSPSLYPCRASAGAQILTA